MRWQDAPGKEAVGNAPPPPAPSDRAADRFYDPAAMAAADRQMRMSMAACASRSIPVQRSSARCRSRRARRLSLGRGGWFGGDIHRLVVKSEGEGTFGDRIGTAEVQALYARALDPYWNLQAGVRQDIGRAARRTYAWSGSRGWPLLVRCRGALFLSDKGELLARTEAWVDQRVTQRAILQPRLEVNFAAQDVPDQRIAAGVSSLELGCAFATRSRANLRPMSGINWSAAMVPAGGGGAALALGIRTWF